ncbi:TIGR00730 family Rossman fold protein [Sphingobacterium sp. WM]|uniref:LOG family protein n=1 Tax=Sphingobacterium sp. WM TaxID=3031802 RepID=UPI00240CF007|nr:TIGR00730 family Rossman fold protein [Sphingobacterium sp. WM]WFB65372.1 TIGR00730 family Rossman fold protein [Sphingobacterium sp. WM]
MSNKFVREEINFLKGARGRWNELKYALGVVFQFMKGFRTLHFVGPCVTVFGSARFGEDHPYYIQARELSAKLAEQGFTIMTGGGPGIMEAANRGAKDVDGNSVGCNIVLPHEQKHNPYMDKFVNIEYFFVRKELLRKYSFAFVIMPGGFGTLDEFFETLTLIQTKKISQFPIVIMGMDYHKNIKEHVDMMIEAKTISPEDQDLLLFTDDIHEAALHIMKYANTNKIVELKESKPSWILGEKKAI